jgi:GGDEF domain-containing protein
MDGRPASVSIDVDRSLAELARLTASLHSSRDAGELASHFERLGEQCLGASVAALVLPDESGAYRVAAGSLRRPATIEQTRKKLGLGRIRDNDALQSAVRHVGANNDARWFEVSDLFAEAPGAECASECTLVPIWTAGEAIGLGLFFVPQTPAASLLASILCEHAGVALQRLRALEQARRLHGIDAALWVPDTAAVRETLGRELSRARRYGGAVAVSFITVDCAPDLREKYGNFYTDHLLRRVGSQLLASVRDTDTLGSAEGGFVIVQPATTRDGAEISVTRLVDDVGAMLSANYPELELSLISRISYATVVSPEDGSSADELLVKLLTSQDWGGQRDELAA